MLTVTVLARPVAAQQRSDNQPGNGLTASASVFGGYVTDVTNAPSPDLQTNAPYAGSILTINYRSLSEKISIATRGSADSRHYRTQPAITAVAFNGSAAVGVQLTSRLKVDTTVASIVSPQFAFSLVPDITLPSDALPSSSMDHGIFRQEAVSYLAAATATLRVSKRGSVTMTYGGGQYKFLGKEYAGYNSRTETYGGGYSHNLTRYMSARLGYYETSGKYPAFANRPPSVVRQRTLDAGVNYSRPLSLSRRTTVSFGTGSGAIDNGTERFYTVTGNASLRHEFGRTWSSNAMYTRGLGIVGGFAQPFFADSVSVDVRGHLTNKVRTTLSGGFADGNIGLGSQSESFSSFQGGARTEVDLKRDRVTAFGSYFYYGYGFDALLGAAAGVPRQVGRHGVRGGLVLTVPIIQERTPRVTR